MNKLNEFKINSEEQNLKQRSAVNKLEYIWIALHYSRHLRLNIDIRTSADIYNYTNAQQIHVWSTN